MAYNGGSVGGIVFSPLWVAAIAGLGFPLAAVVTTQTLNPGQCEALVCEWAGAPIAPAQAQVRACVDNTGYFCDGPGDNNECLEDNNLAQAQDVGCAGGPG